jgi:hypothetical protein
MTLYGEYQSPQPVPASHTRKGCSLGRQNWDIRHQFGGLPPRALNEVTARECCLDYFQRLDLLRLEC